MSSIIFINPDIENCDLINADHTLRDNLSSLIELNNDQSKLIFILSKQCCFSNFLEIPKKNKSLFKKNAKKLIRQDLDPSSNEFIFIGREQKGKLPYVIINEELITSIADIFKKYKLLNNQLYFEASLLSSDQSEWKFLIKDNDEVNVYYNGSIFTSRSSNLSNDVNVLFTQNKKPESLNFYSLNNDNLNKDKIQSITSHNEAKITYTNILDNPSSINQKNAISLKQLLKANNGGSSGWYRNWKSINLSFLSLIMALISMNHYQNITLQAQQFEMRKDNLVQYIFKNEVSFYNASDLEKVINSIKGSKNLPDVIHINTLNHLGEVFGISGVKVDQLSIKRDNSIYLKLHTTKNNSIARINEALQNNDYFLADVRSLQNISDQKTQMEINLNLKEIN
tara:strand:+ start:436 stop:1623 length:1188 start_codon:yes stop_codon:yes gene_type:complete